jgi:hypothetical protein
LTAVDPVVSFVALAGSRAYRFAIGELELYDAVDKLQAHAETHGLVTLVGQDAVQAIMAMAFAAVRSEPTGHATADDEPSLFLKLTSDPLPRRPQVSRKSRERAAKSTLDTAEYLVRQNDVDKLHDWLARHSADERVAILKHFEQKKRTPDADTQRA